MNPACLLAALFVTPAHAPQAARDVPFRIAENAIVVDAVVNGRPVSLMFDSGFGGTVLLNSSLDVGPSSGKMTLRDFVGEIEANEVKLSSLKLGSVSLTPDEPVIVQRPDDFSAAYGQHVDGILGLAALKNLVTEVNFQKHEFIFHPSSDDLAARKPDGVNTFLAKMLPIGGDAIVLPVSTSSGDTMTLSLDTGNAFYATTHRDVLERVGIWQESKQPKYMRKSGVASGAVDSWSCKMPPLTIFGVPVQSTIWDILDLPSSDAQADGTVGFGFLSHFNVTFDYARRRVWLEKWQSPVENQEPGDVGISAHFDREKKRTVVALVAPGSPAADDGITEDDQVLSINGQDLERPSYKEVRRMLEGPVGSEVRLGVSHNGAFKEHVLVRRALVNE